MNGKLRVLDLFSGIGGFSLGLERTGGFETVAFCEIEDYPRRVLKKHWPGVPIYEDVRDITADQLRADGIAADVITGGFPCQDISTAGRQAGITAERSGLWSELCRIIGEVRPRYAIVENVSNLLSGPGEQRGGWFGVVLADLAEVGFDAEWHCIPASAVGAPHIRDRVWIIAYPQHPDTDKSGPHRAQKHLNGNAEPSDQQICLAGSLGEILANATQLFSNECGEDQQQSQRQIPEPRECGCTGNVAHTATSGQQDCEGGARPVNAKGSEPQITQAAEAEGLEDGRLNPTWVEWLMGFPLTWTDLEPSETQSSPKSPNLSDTPS